MKQKKVKFLLKALIFLIGFQVLSVYAQNNEDTNYPDYKLGYKYILVYSEEDHFCQHMLKRYNEDIQRGGKLRPNLHPEYSQIQWNTDAKILTSTFLKLELVSKIFKQSRIAIFDANNDGVNEIVWISQPYYSGGGSGNDWSLSYFDIGLKKKVEIEGINVRDLYQHRLESNLFSNEVDPSQSSRSYQLKKLPIQEMIPFFKDRPEDLTPIYVSNSTWAHIFPLIFEGKSYISLLTSEFPHGKVVDEKFNLISIRQYQPDNSIQDICYYVKTPEYYSSL